MRNSEAAANSENRKFSEKGKTMDNLLTVAFEAHNAELNHHRRYQITVGRDLLDDWTVSICYGRSGQGGSNSRSGVFSLTGRSICILIS